MSSKSEIASVALLDVGGKPISDIENESSKEAKLIRNLWDITVEEVAASHEWSHTKKWKALAEDGSFTMVDDLWEYVYSLPSDYIKMTKQQYQNTSNTLYEIRENRYYTNVEEVLIEYVANISDTTKWTSWFKMAVIARIRSRIPIPLAKNSSKTINWYQLYLTELNTAKTLDAQQSNLSEEEKGNHTVDNDSWVEVATS